MKAKELNNSSMKPHWYKSQSER